MEQHGDELHAETDGARAGSTPNIVRWVLLIGLLLAILFLSATWITGAISMGPRGSQATATDRIADESRESEEATDSVVSDGMDELRDTAPAVETSGAPTAIEN